MLSHLYDNDNNDFFFLPHLSDSLLGVKRPISRSGKTQVWQYHISIEGFHPREIKSSLNESKRVITVHGMHQNNQFTKSVQVPRDVDLQSITEEFTDTELILRGYRHVTPRVSSFEQPLMRSYQPCSSSTHHDDDVVQEQQHQGSVISTRQHQPKSNFFELPQWHILSGEMRQMQQDFEHMLEGTTGMDTTVMPRMEVTDQGHKLHIDFDVRGFKPEEIQVRQVGEDRMVVEAKHENKSKRGASVRTIHQEFQLPRNVLIGQMRSELKRNGVLTLEAPCDLKEGLGPQRKVSEIPIQRLQNKQQ